VQQFFAWLESTELARTVGESLQITAWLSAIHVLGFTLVMSAGMIWSLYASGAVLRGTPRESVTRPAVRLLALGLSLSLVTGFALFAPRASSTAPNPVFQLKIALLLSAATYQFVLYAWALRNPNAPVSALRAGGILGTMLWASLAITACWFILFE
jgi:hypothetical protein